MLTDHGHQMRYLLGEKNKKLPGADRGGWNAILEFSHFETEATFYLQIF